MLTDTGLEAVEDAESGSLAVRKSSRQNGRSAADLAQNTGLESQSLCVNVQFGRTTPAMSPSRRRYDFPPLVTNFIYGTNGDMGLIS